MVDIRREFHKTLPDNYHLSVKRLKGLLCWLRHIPDVLREYDVIQTSSSRVSLKLSLIMLF